MLLFLITTITCQSIHDGLKMVEKSFKYTYDKSIINQNCKPIFNLPCKIQQLQIPSNEQQLKEYIDEEANIFLSLIESDQEYYPYYQGVINQITKEIGLYDNYEEYISILLDFDSFKLQKELKLIEHKYYLDLQAREIHSINVTNNTFKEHNASLFIYFKDLYIPKQGRQSYNAISNNLLYHPNFENIQTAEREGVISFSKGVYLSQFFTKCLKKVSKITLGYQDGQTSSLEIQENEGWVLIRGSVHNQVINITLSKNTAIDSILLKVKKVMYTQDQIQMLLVQKLLQKQQLLGQEIKLNKKMIQDNFEKQNKKQKVIVLQDLNYNEIDNILDFLDQVFDEIKQVKLKEQHSKLNSNQILGVIELIVERNQNKNDFQKYKNILEIFFQSELNEEEVELLQQQLVQAKLDLKEN